MDANNEAERVGPGGEVSEEQEFLQDNEGPAVQLPIEDSLDLHTFSPGEIKPLIEEYLYQCQQREFHEVRIIHGRGTGTQRKIVRSLLARNPRVAAFKDAAPESGGWGATMVTLRPKDPHSVQNSVPE
jgi:DNA-nicking Smr family endonuclease